MSPPDPEPPAIRPLLLRCTSCGRSTECQPADLVRHADLGWPRCCGEVMALASPAGPLPSRDGR